MREGGGREGKGRGGERVAHCCSLSDKTFFSHVRAYVVCGVPHKLRGMPSAPQQMARPGFRYEERRLSPSSTAVGASNDTTPPPRRHRS
jgi:hypothetical protein